MKHYYKITDPFEIRVAVLYTLYKAERALTAYEISHILLGSAKIDFFDIHDALSFLTEAKEIYQFRSMENKTLYALTETGAAAAQDFSRQVPLEVQEYIDDCICELFEEQKKQSGRKRQKVIEKKFQNRCRFRRFQKLLGEYYPRKRFNIFSHTDHYCSGNYPAEK